MKRNSSSGKTEETAAQTAHSENDTYTTKIDRCSRRFGRRFSSEASRRLRAIFFINKGSDRRLRTSPSRGYCWGLDLRVKPSPSEMLPNLFAGPQRNGAKRNRRYRMNTKKLKLKEHDLRTEGHHLLKAKGDEWPPRSTNAKTNTFGGEGYRLHPAEGDRRLLRSTSSKTRTFGSRDQLRERR